MLAAILHSDITPLFPCKPSYFLATSTITKTHCRNRIFFRKFETKDMEHKVPFCRLLLHINPLASSLCSRCSPLFLQPFPLIIGHRHSECPQLDISPQIKTAHHLHSYLYASMEKLCFYYFFKWSRPEILNVLNDYD